MLESCRDGEPSTLPPAPLFFGDTERDLRSLLTGDAERSRDRESRPFDTERPERADRSECAERERDRFTERERDRFVLRERDRFGERECDRFGERECDRFAERERDERLADRERERLSERERERERLRASRLAERDRERERERDASLAAAGERDRDRERERAAADLAAAGERERAARLALRERDRESRLAERRSRLPAGERERERESTALRFSDLDLVFELSRWLRWCKRNGVSVGNYQLYGPSVSHVVSSNNKQKNTTHVERDRERESRLVADLARALPPPPRDFERLRDLERLRDERADLRISIFSYFANAFRGGGGRRRPIAKTNWHTLPGARTTTRTGARTRAGRTRTAAASAATGSAATVLHQPDATAVQVGVVQLVDGVLQIGRRGELDDAAARGKTINHYNMFS